MPSLFILALVVASVTALETTTFRGSPTVTNDFGSTMLGNNNTSTLATPSITTNTTTNATSISITTSAMNVTTIIAPSTTKQKSTKSSGDGKAPNTTKPKMSSTTYKTTSKATTTAKPQPDTGDNTGIIILVVIILVALGFGVACYFARKRGRRYSVDFASRPDDVNIPLSTVEPELPVEAVSQNGLKTFESAETATLEQQEPEAKPEVEEEEQKAEADESVADPSAESAASVPSPDSAEEKPKEDVVEQGSPGPVEPTVEVKTDDEGVDSNKTSVESLKETNENNSNNADFSQQRAFNLFWDVPLDCPV